MDVIHSATEATIDGRRVLLAGTNNYLGLTFAPETRDAAIHAIQTQGTGTTGSRMASGNYAGHRALEQEFAEAFGWPGSIVFSTGYQANLGAISRWPGRAISCWWMLTGTPASMTPAACLRQPPSAFVTMIRKISPAAWSDLARMPSARWWWWKASTACWAIARR